VGRAVASVTRSTAANCDFRYGKHKLAKNLKERTMTSGALFDTSAVLVPGGTLIFWFALMWYSARLLLSWRG
jgi:hypothetical protein